MLVRVIVAVRAVVVDGDNGSDRPGWETAPMSGVAPYAGSNVQAGTAMVS